MAKKLGQIFLLSLIVFSGAEAYSASCDDSIGRQVLLSQTIDNGKAFCVYGGKDTSVNWLYSLHVFDDSGSTELSYPPVAEGLGMFTHYEMQRVVPELLDINFDGKTDVALFAYLGGGGNSGKNYWVYNPETGQYTFETTLSGRAVTLDESTKTLTSGWTGGHAGGIFQRETYRWIGQAAVLVYEESRRWNSSKSCYDHRIQEWQDGALIETHAVCETEKHEQ